jgi:hypothetical protein
MSQLSFRTERCVVGSQVLLAAPASLTSPSFPSRRAWCSWAPASSACSASGGCAGGRLPPEGGPHAPALRRERSGGALVGRGGRRRAREVLALADVGPLGPLPGVRTARSLAIYASQCGLPRHHARLASGRWPSSAGRGLVAPQGSIERFPRYIASPFPKLSWRT